MAKLTRLSPRRVSSTLSTLKSKGLVAVAYHPNNAYKLFTLNVPAELKAQTSAPQTGDAPSQGSGDASSLAGDTPSSIDTVEKQSDKTEHPKGCAASGCGPAQGETGKETEKKNKNENYEIESLVNQVTQKAVSTEEKARAIVTNYSLAAAKGSWKARTAAWHKLGRLYFPKLPRFSGSHKVTNGEMKDMDLLYQRWGNDTLALIHCALAHFDELNVLDANINGWNNAKACYPSPGQLHVWAEIIEIKHAEAQAETYPQPAPSLFGYL